MGIMLVLNSNFSYFSSNISRKVHMMTSVVEDFFEKWDLSTATLIREVYEPQKINLIWSHFMRVSWSAYELFN